MLKECNDITSREAYEYFRKNRKFNIKAIDQYNYYKKAVEGLFFTIREILSESQGGVYIEGLGYFCFVIYPKKMKKKGKKLQNESLFRSIRKKNTYFLYFFPDLELEGYILTENKYIPIEAKREDYKLHFNICQNYRINRLITRRKQNFRNGEFDYKTELTTKILQKNDLNTIYSRNRK